MQKDPGLEALLCWPCGTGASQRFLWVGCSAFLFSLAVSNKEDTPRGAMLGVTPSTAVHLLQNCNLTYAWLGWKWICSDKHWGALWFSRGAEKISVYPPRKRQSIVHGIGQRKGITPCPSHNNSVIFVCIVPCDSINNSFLKVQVWWISKISDSRINHLLKSV